MRTKLISACKRVLGDGDLKIVNVSEKGYRWYVRDTGKAHWLGFTLADCLMKVQRLGVEHRTQEQKNDDAE